MNKFLKSNGRGRRTLARSSVTKALLLGASTISFSASPVFAQETQQRSQAGAQISFDIPAQSLANAVTAFGLQSGYQISVDQATLAGLNSPGVSGNFAPVEALSRLLSGSGVTWRVTDARSVTLYRAPQSADGTITLGPVRVEGESNSSGSYSSISSDAGATEGTNSYAMRGPSTTATRMDMTIRETPQTISVVTRDRIEDQALYSITSVLQQIPGISVGGIGSERFGVTSRGYGINNYQIDSVPTYVDITTQATSQMLADMAIYDRVEVLRGASGLLSGAGDPGGSINMVRKRPTNEFRGYFNAAVGSWEHFRGELDLGGPVNEAGTVRMRAVAAYQHKKSFIDYYRAERYTLYTTVEADLSPSTLVRAGVDYQVHNPKGSQSSLGIPLWYDNGEQTNFSRSFSTASRDNINKQSTMNSFVAINQKFGDDWSLNVTANYLKSDVDALFIIGRTYTTFANKDTGDGIIQSQYSTLMDHHQHGIDTQIKGSFSFLGIQSDAIFGFNYSKYSNKTDASLDLDSIGTVGQGLNIYSWDGSGRTARGTKVSDINTFVRQIGGYGSLRIRPADNLAIIFGGRLSDYKYQFTTDNWYYEYYVNNNLRVKSEFTPYAGIVWDIADRHSLYASYTRIFQAQSTQDKDANLIAPRRGSTYEAGVKSEIGAGALATLAAYYTLQNNLAVLDSGQIVTGTTNTAAYKAVNGAKTWGFDAEITGELTPGWNLSASYTFSRTDDRFGDRITKVFPMHMAKLWTTWNLPGQYDRFTVGGGINWQSKSSITATPWYYSGTLYAEQPSYAVVNLMGRYRIADNMTATVNVNNLFDKKYLSALDETFFSTYYGDPRNFMVNLKYNF